MDKYVHFIIECKGSLQDSCLLQAIWHDQGIAVSKVIVAQDLE